MPGDNDFLSRKREVEQMGQIALGFMYVELRHDFRLARISGHIKSAWPTARNFASWSVDPYRQPEMVEAQRVMKGEEIRRASFWPVLTAGQAPWVGVR